jgi:transcriptional regulator with XRE-family HTH domain
MSPQKAQNTEITQLIEARITKNISKTEMAAMLNMSRNTYDRLEQGKCDYSDLQRMADILGFKLILLPKSYFD